MKKWIKVFILIAIILCIFWVGIEITYSNISGTECCPCYDGCYTTGDIETNCIECCECSYNIFEKIEMIMYYYNN